jgi:hypothetical protein
MSLEFDAFNLVSFHVDDVKLEHIFGNVHANDRHICGTLHDGAFSSGGDDESPLWHIDAVAARLPSLTHRPFRGRRPYHLIYSGLKPAR